MTALALREGRAMGEISKSLEEIDPFWRLHNFAAGRALSADDVQDIQQVLNDYNDEIGENADRHQVAREQVLREIGGEDLVQMAAKADSIQSAVAVKKAMAHFQAKCLEYEGKAALPSEASKLREALLAAKEHIIISRRPETNDADHAVIVKIDAALRSTGGDDAGR